jgi:uncharacterized protein YcbK (DUF882 family)
MMAAASVAAVAQPRRLLAIETAVRTLDLDHCHTRETLSITYCEEGCYLPEALQQIDRFLRDFRTGEVKPIDPQLLDMLDDLKLATATRKPFQVISGYRSASTNAKLRENGTGVAAHSLHMAGKAIDIRLGDVPTRVLRDAALRLARGGVGYYPLSDFVHVDTGRVRKW